MDEVPGFFSFPQKIKVFYGFFFFFFSTVLVGVENSASGTKY